MKKINYMNSTWKNGISDEIRFWDDWLATKGDGSAEYASRVDPDTELQQYIVDLIDMEKVLRSGRLVPSILDVGAGPITYYGKKIKGSRYNLMAIDALADQYDDLLKKHGLDPIVRTKKWDSEDVASLPYYFGNFDVITARNTLDHSYDPLKAIMAMPSKLNPGGAIYMQHLIKVAECAQYNGLHQWNFYLENECLFLTSKSEKFNVTKIFSDKYPGCEFQYSFIEHEIIYIIKMP
jgi:SAM-dependent methyltransferase